MNALDPRPIPAKLAAGHGFHTVGKARTTVTANASRRVVLFVTNTGASGTLMLFLSSDGGKYTTTVPTLTLAADAGGPTAGRALKATLRLTNVTKRLNQGGAVYVGELDQRLALPQAPSTMTAAEIGASIDGIIALNASHAHDGVEFARPHEFSCGIADATDFEDFGPWFGAYSVDNFARHFAVWPGSGHDKRPMTTRYVIFETIADANDYVAEVVGQWYTRWPTGHILSDHMSKIKTTAKDPPKGDR